MKILIKGQEYDFSFENIWGPIYSYEVLAGEKLPFNPHRTLCMHILYYSILLRANPGMTLTFDEFMSAINDVRLVNKMAEYYVKRMEVLSANDAGNEESSDNSDVDNKKKD